jgi:zinc and cadmium transporter
MLNVCSGAAGVLGAMLMFLAIAELPRLLPYVLPFSAGGLLYVAMADLIPGLHRGPTETGAVRQVVLLAAGVATIMAI